MSSVRCAVNSLFPRNGLVVSGLIFLLEHTITNLLKVAMSFSS